MTDPAAVDASTTPPPEHVEHVDVGILDAVEHITVPWPFDEFTCPACERTIPTRKQFRMAIPAKYEHLLNQCFKCPWCNFIFSPKKVEASLIRR